MNRKERKIKEYIEKGLNSKPNFDAVLDKLEIKDKPVFKTPFYKNQSCKVNLIKIRDNEENRMNQSLIQKIKFQQKIKDENEYFNNFQQKLDYIINESMNVRSISESEDIDISLNK